MRGVGGGRGRGEGEGEGDEQEDAIFLDTHLKKAGVFVLFVCAGFGLRIPRPKGPRPEPPHWNVFQNSITSI